MNWLNRFILAAIVVTAALLLVVDPALAQPADGGPPIPTLNRSPHAAIGYGIMFVLAVAVIAVSIMPSKRGHQD